MNSELLSDFHRSLRRRNVSGYTVRNYLQAVIEFSQYVSQPSQAVTFVEIGRYVERLQARGLAAKTINSKLSAVRQFYAYLQHDHLPGLVNPVRKWDFLREPWPLPRGGKGSGLALQHLTNCGAFQAVTLERWVIARPNPIPPIPCDIRFEGVRLQDVLPYPPLR